MINPFFFAGHEITPLRRLLYLKGIAGENEVEYTVTGNPVTFQTTLAKPLTGLTIPFLPVQSGSGDPNPIDNIRPITGWTGASIWHYPENLLTITRSSSQDNNGIKWTLVKDADNNTVAVHAEGTKASGSNPFYTLNYVNSTTLAVPPGEYKCYGGNSDIAFQVQIINANGNEQNVVNNNDGTVKTFTVPSDAKASWARLTCPTSSAVDKNVYPILVNSDETITTIPVTFPDGLTVYGGYIDAVTGSVVAEWAGYDMGGLTWIKAVSQTSGAYRMRCSGFASVIKPSSANNVVGDIICSVYKTIAADATYLKTTGVCVSNDGNIFVYDPDYNTESSMDSFTEAVDGQIIAFELATPIVVATIDPITLNTLANQVNTVWTDTNGTNEVKYLSK